MTPLITTIIPTYRRPQKLSRAIQSAQNQTFKNIRIIIYDDQSNDETESIVREITKQDPRVLYHRNSIRLHSLKNFQQGLDLVTTPFCSILSDDDLLAPSFYETALSLLRQHQEAAFFLGSVIDRQEDGTIVSANAQKWPREGVYHFPEGLFLMINRYINWTGVLFRRAAAQSLVLDPRTEALDFDFLLRLSSKHPFVFSKKTCAFFIHHTGSYSNHCGAKLFWPGFRITAHTLIQEHPLFANKIRGHMEHKLKKELFRLVIKHLIKNQRRDAEDVLTLYSREYPDRSSKILRCLSVLCKRIPLFLRALRMAYTGMVQAKRTILSLLLAKEHHH